MDHRVAYYSSIVKIPGVNFGNSNPKQRSSARSGRNSQASGSIGVQPKGFDTASERNDYVLTCEYINQYQLGKTIGNGRFGVIRQIDQVEQFHRSELGEKANHPLAMKIMNKKLNPKVSKNETRIYTHLMRRQQVQDIDYMRHFTLPIEIFEHQVPNAAPSVCIVFEYLPAGDLFDIIVTKNSVSESDTKLMMDSLLKTLKILHSNQVVHRDIKPENVLFRQDDNNNLLYFSPLFSLIFYYFHRFSQPVLTDFGLSYLLHSPDLVDCPAGTFGYASPEILSTGIETNTS